MSRGVAVMIFDVGVGAETEKSASENEIRLLNESEHSIIIKAVE